MDYLIPEQLETKRLMLRMARLDDSNAVHEYYSDPECTKYTTRRPLRENESWQKLAALAGHWTLHRYGSYVLEEKSLDRVIGITRNSMGLARKFWGKGYASEAARAVKEMAASYLPLLSLISLMHPENQNSINLAKSLGAPFEKELLFKR